MNSLKIRALLSGLLASTVIATVGCGPARSVNPWALRRENTQLRAALRQSQDHLAESRVRADNLDADNEQLHNELALQQEELRLAQEERQRLASQRRAPAENLFDDEEKDFGPARGRTAAAPKKATPVTHAETEPNWAPLAEVAGAQVMREGDAVRIRITDANLFDPGKATLKPGATRTLDQVASSLRRNYSNQLVGIEGHTDADPIRKSKWKDNHELSLERAKAVYEYLRTKGGFHSEQLYVAGFGSNRPIASNSSSGGKAQNRRVEFVVHPAGARAARDGDPR